MSLNIPLPDGWSLGSDVNNIILRSPEGRCYFYGQITTALESYFEKIIRRSDAQSIAELIQFLKTAVKNLNEAIAPLHIKAVAGEEAGK